MDRRMFFQTLFATVAYMLGFEQHLSLRDELRRLRPPEGWKVGRSLPKSTSPVEFFAYQTTGITIGNPSAFCGKF